MTAKRWGALHVLEEIERGAGLEGLVALAGEAREPDRAWCFKVPHFVFPRPVTLPRISTARCDVALALDNPAGPAARGGGRERAGAEASHPRAGIGASRPERGQSGLPTVARGGPLALLGQVPPPAQLALALDGPRAAPGARRRRLAPRRRRPVRRVLHVRVPARDGDGRAPRHGSRDVVHRDQLPRARLGHLGPGRARDAGRVRGRAPEAARLVRAPRVLGSVSRATSPPSTSLGLRARRLDATVSQGTLRRPAASRSRTF